eukprot:SAG11_NODE_12379_length_706_cov_1.266886_2_plen_108_part_01
MSAVLEAERAKTSLELDAKLKSFGANLLAEIRGPPPPASITPAKQGPVSSPPPTVPHPGAVPAAGISPASAFSRLLAQFAGLCISLYLAVPSARFRTRSFYDVLKKHD